MAETRIKELCEQFLRAESPDVMQAVASNLHKAIDDHVEESTRESSADTLDTNPPQA